MVSSLAGASLVGSSLAGVLGSPEKGPAETDPLDSGVVLGAAVVPGKEDIPLNAPLPEKVMFVPFESR